MASQQFFRVWIDLQTRRKYLEVCLQEALL